MSEPLHDNRRIAKNTLALFFRMVVLMLISLYTSRVILQALGVTDFGIYNVIGGFVSMFAIISSAMSSSIGRYLTVALGKGDREQMARIFSTSVNVLYIICIVLVVLLETFGLWFVNTKLTIPYGRLTAANWVFQISILTFIVDIISLPYNALVISHERMTAFAYIGIYEALGKLGVSFLVMVSPIDRLVFYALLLAVVAVSVRVIYTVYCRRHFPESHYRFAIDKPLMKEMFSFSGWNFFGISSSMLADQGVNMILNVFCGPVVNAARGIAMQVSTAVGSFCGSFTTALNPQLTKSYAANERDYCLRLCDRSVRFSFYLYFIVALPVMFTAPLLLQLWLGIVPAHTVNFVRLVLLSSLFTILSNPLVTLLLATGEIKVYQIWVGGFRFIVLPVCWLLLWLGCQPEIVFVVTICTELCCLALRLLRLKIQTAFPVRLFIKHSIATVFVIAIASVILPAIVNILVVGKWTNFLTVCLVSVLSSVTIIYRFGMSDVERGFVKGKALQIIHLLKAS